MSDWSQLPYDLVALIGNYLTTFEDFVAFSAACRSWRLVYRNKAWRPGRQFPWLMLSEKRNARTRSFFSFNKSKLYEIRLPQIRGKRCWGSSCGWLVITGYDLEVSLLNPLTGAQITLPPQFMFPKEKDLPIVLDWSRFIYKAIVIKGLYSSLETGEAYVVVAIYGLEKHLAFAKPGFNSWTLVKTSFPASFRDVAWFKGHIFALCEMGVLVLCELDGSDPPRALYFGELPDYDWGCWDQIYLVESAGDLLMVVRRDYDILTEYYYETMDFKVYKFDFGTRCWVLLQDLGGQALFVGHCCSMSLSASAISDCEANSIYFTVDKLKRWWKYKPQRVGRDMGVYNVVDKSFKHLYSGIDSPSYYSRPIWFMPALS